MAPVTIAMLAAFHAVVSMPIQPELCNRHVEVALNRFAAALVSTQMTPFYRFCSSGDHTRANYALQLLSVAASYSPFHSMEFLHNFNFAFNMLPKLAAPPRNKPPTSSSGKHSTVTPITTAHSPGANWNNTDVAMQPSRELFLSLAVAVIRSAPPGPGVAKALHAPQMLPLVMHNLATDAPQAIIDLCTILLSRVLTPGALLSHRGCPCAPAVP